MTVTITDPKTGMSSTFTAGRGITSSFAGLPRTLRPAGKSKGNHPRSGLHKCECKCGYAGYFTQYWMEIARPLCPLCRVSMKAKFRLRSK